MKLEEAVLVVIDMQNGFVNERSTPIIPAVVRLVDRWQRVGGATIFTRFVNGPGSPWERLIHWTKLQRSPETDIIDELLPQAARATHVADKENHYTLFNAEGSATVEAGGWRDLVFCGLATESCVLKSAVDAFERGYTPWVVHDASYSHAGEEAHRAGLLVARRFLGRNQIIDADDLLAAVRAAA